MSADQVYETSSPAVRSCGVALAAHFGWRIDPIGHPVCVRCGERIIDPADRQEVLRLMGRGRSAVTQKPPKRRKARLAVVDTINGRLAMPVPDVVPSPDGVRVLSIPNGEDVSVEARAARQVAVRSTGAKAAFIRGWKEKYGLTCFYCERPLIDPDDPDYARHSAEGRDRLATNGYWPTLDHVIPAKHGGPAKVWNLVVACGPCNSSKGDDLAHLVRFVYALRDDVRRRDERIDGQQTLIQALKADLIALGSDVEPHYTGRYLSGGGDGHPTHCRRCGVEFVPGVKHRCIPRPLRDLYAVYDVYGRRAVSALIAENHYDERRRTTTIRDRARGAARAAAARAAARAAASSVSTEDP